MSPRPWRDRVEDILVCARNIREFVAGQTMDSFLSDPKTIRAVAYELTTIGEAVRTIPSDIRDRYPQVPWGRMLGIRNALVHEYFRLDEEILWNTAQHDIPELILVLEELLAAGGRPNSLSG